MLSHIFKFITTYFLLRVSFAEQAYQWKRREVLLFARGRYCLSLLFYGNACQDCLNSTCCDALWMICAQDEVEKAKYNFSCFLN